LPSPRDDFFADSSCIGAYGPRLYADRRLAACATACETIQAVDQSFRPYLKKNRAGPRFSAAALTWLLASGKPITVVPASKHLTLAETRVYANDLEAASKMAGSAEWLEPLLKQAKIKVLDSDAEPALRCRVPVC
jgi:hypothetical protein